jgi:hypothetical protein
MRQPPGVGAPLPGDAQQAMSVVLIRIAAR